MAVVEAVTLASEAGLDKPHILLHTGYAQLQRPAVHSPAVHFNVYLIEDWYRSR